MGINFPFAAGRGGSTEVEVDWLVQVKRTAMSQLAEDPIHYVRLMEERPYRLNGKSYAFTLVHRVELPPGQGPRVVEDPTPRNPRRAPEHDPYPMTRGDVADGRQMANAGRTGRGRQLGFRADDPLNPQLERAQHFWDHESYYTFRLASGFGAPHPLLPTWGGVVPPLLCGLLHPPQDPHRALHGPA
ncbi:hypothetical protein [Thermus sp.]|uniref:hypothetical protein n=1 Tax=Thermus sp. TaxID=275 RepID=UPI00298F28EB|nr:hypothetical protein [Thermus sp.]MDW8358602.1 hypothetical protein [Thermus sp.]